jgi:hypothetical protein
MGWYCVAMRLMVKRITSVEEIMAQIIVAALVHKTLLV